MFNDRLLLGLKGTMSEAELHVPRARLLGGIRNKAARGELRRGLPVGFVWGDEDGEVRFHPDEAVCVAIRTVFARFAELGSVRRVWLWLRTEGLSFPMQTRYGGGVRWVDPSYIAVYHVLTNPVYAGAYRAAADRSPAIAARRARRSTRSPTWSAAGRARRPRGAAPDLDQRRVEGVGGPLTAPFDRRGQSVPAGGRPIAIGLFPTRRHRHCAILEQRAMRVADAVERRDHFVGELPRLFDNGGG